MTSPRRRARERPRRRARGGGRRASVEAARAFGGPEPCQTSRGAGALCHFDPKGVLPRPWGRCPQLGGRPADTSPRGGPLCTPPRPTLSAPSLLWLPRRARPPRCPAWAPYAARVGAEQSVNGHLSAQRRPLRLFAFLGKRRSPVRPSVPHSPQPPPFARFANRHAYLTARPHTRRKWAAPALAARRSKARSGARERRIVPRLTL